VSINDKKVNKKKSENYAKFRANPTQTGPKSCDTKTMLKRSLDKDAYSLWTAQFNLNSCGQI
jgi:hypothetical protein